MVRRICVAGGALIAVALLASAAFPKGDTPKAAPADDASLAGKVLGVNLKDGVGGWIQDARVCQLGGRTFLTGPALKSPNADGPPDSATWIAVDDVQTIVVYNSVADVLKAYEVRCEMRPLQKPYDPNQLRQPAPQPEVLPGRAP